MKHIKRYKIFESDNSSIWNEIEDILTPIKDDGILSFDVKNFKYVPSEDHYLNPDKIHREGGNWNGSRSSILIKKDWDMLKTLSGLRHRDERFFNLDDIKDELLHLCSRFPEIVNRIQIFRTIAKNPERYTPEEFIEKSPTGKTFLVGITFKIEKEGATFIPN